MISKLVSTIITVSVISLSATTLKATESFSQSNSSLESDSTFVCASQLEPPTMFAYTPGEVELEPLISWHEEYIHPEESAEAICQQVANKLEARKEQNKPTFISTQTLDNGTSVCLVSQENETCQSSNSEELFKVSAGYAPACVINNTDPLECAATSRTRGVFGMPETSYSPSWWPF